MPTIVSVEEGPYTSGVTRFNCVLSDRQQVMLWGVEELLLRKKFIKEELLGLTEDQAWEVIPRRLGILVKK